LIIFVKTSIILTMVETHEGLNLLDPYLQEYLKSVYTKVKDWPDFPRGLCELVSDKIIVEHELSQVRGRFRLDKPGFLPGATFVIHPSHHWVESAEGHIIDFTVSQFNPWLNKSIQPEILVITSRHSLYSRYIPDKRRVYSNFEYQPWQKVK
jgi:hypothetical protein